MWFGGGSGVMLGWCWGGMGWCGGGVGVVWGWCRSWVGVVVVWGGVGWHHGGRSGVVLSQEGVGHALTSSNMSMTSC